MFKAQKEQIQYADCRFKSKIGFAIQNMMTGTKLEFSQILQVSILSLMFWACSSSYQIDIRHIYLPCNFSAHCTSGSDHGESTKKCFLLISSFDEEWFLFLRLCLAVSSNIPVYVAAILIYCKILNLWASFKNKLFQINNIYMLFSNQSGFHLISKSFKIYNTKYFLLFARVMTGDCTCAPDLPTDVISACTE